MMAKLINAKDSKSIAQSYFMRTTIFMLVSISGFTYFLVKYNNTNDISGHSLYIGMVSPYRKTDEKQNSLVETVYNRRIGTEINRNEVRQITFLKVHRTGSGTMKQIFLKFGHERNLTFVLPNLRDTRTRGVISEIDTLTNTNILPPPMFKSYDVLCCHVIYDPDAFKAVLPADAVYIGAVREPLSRFQSAVHFYEPAHILEIQGQTPLSTYSENPLKYEPSDPRFSMTNNRMAVDFGFPLHLFPGRLKNDSKNEINKYLRQLDNDFKLIIVNEQFVESLVLMKRILNWGIRDILFINKHVTKAFRKRDSLSGSDKQTIKEFLNLDYVLYEFAVKRLNKQIQKEGDAFQTEVNYFRYVIKCFKDYCEGDMLVDSPMVFQSTSLNSAFKLSKTDCTLLQMKNLNDNERVRMYGSLNQ